ncbi:hypothetical protein C8J57DRAFT_1222017 [Mycena rebaudengoi]|nr:hypothetical protein C8J57DRAFT_1222017 [Mycena rebaudengoi]
MSATNNEPAFSLPATNLVARRTRRTSPTRIHPPLSFNTDVPDAYDPLLRSISRIPVVAGALLHCPAIVVLFHAAACDYGPSLAVCSLPHCRRNHVPRQPQPPPSTTPITKNSKTGAIAGGVIVLRQAQRWSANGAEDEDDGVGRRLAGTSAGGGVVTPFMADIGGAAAYPHQQHYEEQLYAPQHYTDQQAYQQQMKDPHFLAARLIRNEGSAWSSASAAKIHGKLVVPPSNYQIGTVI